jgi:hypothetical protein
MTEPVNPIFEATADDLESTLLNVQQDGRIVVSQGSYSAKLSLADSIGLAALVSARSNPNNRLCTCGHRYGQHMGTGRCGGGFLVDAGPLAFVNGPCPCSGWTPKP